MDRNHLIQLTQNLYCLTLLFPKKEPLRYKMRELADNILADLIRPFKEKKLWEDNLSTVLNDLEVLDGFFEVAKAQNWVSVVDLSRLQEEYNRIKAEIKKIEITQIRPVLRIRPVSRISQVKSVSTNLVSSVSSAPGVEMNKRQQRILEFLKENNQAQVWQIKQIFPEVTKRTLRRDFEFLLKQGIIKRIGQRNDTFYQLPTSYESK